MLRLARHLLFALLLVAPALIGTAEAGGPLQVRLSGTGNTTLRTAFHLRNTGSEPIHVNLEPQGVYSRQGRQALMLLEGRTVELAPGAEARTTLRTMCLGDREQDPAAPEPAEYVLEEQPQDLVKIAAACQEAAALLKERGDLDPLPIPPALRAETVAQLAFWAERGNLDRTGLREEILRQMGRSDADLSPEEKEEVDQGVELTWDAVDLTRKEAASK